MKNLIFCVFFFLLPISCTKEEDTFEISNNENTVQIEAYKKHVLNSKRNKALTPKIAYKKWQKSMRELELLTTNDDLLYLCSIAKKIKLADEIEIKRRGLLSRIGTDEIFTLKIFFSEKIDTNTFLASFYDPNTNLIIIFDYKNITKFGEDLSGIASVYSHEINHYLGFKNGDSEEKDHQNTENIEKAVLSAFHPEILDSLKLHHLWGNDSTAQKFIGEYFANSGEITRVNARNIYLGFKITSPLPPPSE